MLQLHFIQLSPATPDLHSVLERRSMFERVFGDHANEVAVSLAFLILFVVLYLFVRMCINFADAVIEGEKAEAEREELFAKRQQVAAMELANREKEAAHKAEILGHRDSAIAREKKREEEERRHAAELAAIRDRMQGGHR